MHQRLLQIQLKLKSFNLILFLQPNGFLSFKPLTIYYSKIIHNQNHKQEIYFL